MTDSLLLDYARSIDNSLGRIAATLEVLAKIADELATTQEERRHEAQEARR